MYKSDIITMLRPIRTKYVSADWCNGSTADSDSVSRGSSPLSVVKNLRKQILNYSFQKILYLYRSVAQLGRALRSGRRGRVFESRHSDFFPPFYGGFFYGMKRLPKFELNAFLKAVILSLCIPKYFLIDFSNAAIILNLKKFS